MTAWALPNATSSFTVFPRSPIGHQPRSLTGIEVEKCNEAGESMFHRAHSVADEVGKMNEASQADVSSMMHDRDVTPSRSANRVALILAIVCVSGAGCSGAAPAPVGPAPAAAAAAA